MIGKRYMNNIISNVSRSTESILGENKALVNSYMRIIERAVSGGRVKFNERRMSDEGGFISYASLGFNGAFLVTEEYRATVKMKYDKTKTTGIIAICLDTDKAVLVGLETDRPSKEGIEVHVNADSRRPPMVVLAPDVGLIYYLATRSSGVGEVPALNLSTEIGDIGKFRGMVSRDTYFMLNCLSMKVPQQMVRGTLVPSRFHNAG